MPAKLDGPFVVINRLSDTRRAPEFPEFIALLAMMISLVAMSIDAMIPALSQIGKELAVQRDNSTQLIISLFIFGIAVGQMIYGPLSDRTGRRPAVFAGFGLFMVGCLLSLAAVNFSMMLVGRIIQGLGLAGPRVVAMAIIRDQYEGRAMARVMSFIMAVFIVVPAIAPALGQAILTFAGWRAIFGAFLFLALTFMIWFAARQPETLPPQHRIRFSMRRASLVFREICASRAALGYTIAAGLIFGAFQGYLNSAQQILQIQYQRGEWSPLYYAVLAFSVGGASLMNSRLVMRYGMRSLIRWSSQNLACISGLFLAIASILHGHPPLWTLMTYLMTSFFCLGLLFGNLNALAMKPLGHIAGSGAAMVGSFSILLAVPLGIIIGQAYNGTILPLVGGFALLGAASAIVIRRTETQHAANPE
jgi:DHA1 family bicyclomycin/chloramphenicol resistance-like MFS transporter